MEKKITPKNVEISLMFEDREYTVNYKYLPQSGFYTVWVIDDDLNVLLDKRRKVLPSIADAIEMLTRALEKLTPTI